MPRKARIDAPGALHHIIARGIERISGDSDFVQSVLKDSQEQVERRCHLMTRGDDFDWLMGYVAKSLGLEQNIVTGPGRYPNTVRARSVLCHWATRELGISTLELSKRLNISQPTASQSAKRGAAIVREEGFKLET